jgi:hypothetical protein
VFDGETTDNIKDYKARLILKEGATTIFNTAYPLPFAFKEQTGFILATWSQVI